MPSKKFKCPKCDRTFSMAAHLARHTSTMHATNRKNAAKKKSSSKSGKKRAYKKRGAVGRPAGVSNRFGLSSMTLDELGKLIAAARSEARARIRNLEASL